LTITLAPDHLIVIMEKRMRNLCKLVAIVLTTAASAACAQTVSTPAELISAMHGRYSAKWYRTLTFEQQSITHKPDGTSSTEIWHEALLLPGNLRVNIGDAAAGNGMLFVKNQLYIFHDGKLANQRDYVHPLLVLGFDVYAQPVDVTLQELKDLHFDLALMHEEDFNGRPAYVVGAAKGNLHTKQFWIDKERLYFVRLLEPSEKEPPSEQDIRFDDYKQVSGGGWLAEHVEVLADGKLVFEERYSDVKINPPLSADLFDPERFAQARSATPAPPKQP
jgi:hypothetical protein